MNSSLQTKSSDNSTGSYALAGSLLLHVGIIALFSAWQWDSSAPEKIQPKVIHVKFVTVPSPPKTAPRQTISNSFNGSPAQPITVRSATLPPLKARTPEISKPISRTTNAVQRVSHPSKIAHKNLTQPQPIEWSNSRPISPLRSEVLPLKGRGAISQRSPATQVRRIHTRGMFGRVALRAGPIKSNYPVLVRHRHPVDTTASLASARPRSAQHKSEDTHYKQTVQKKYAALPRYFSNDLPEEEDDKEAGADLNLLRGAFTGKVRQRISEAKHYPRMARRRGMEGRPVIAFTLDKQGRLQKVDLARTSGYPLLDRAALQAVQKGAPYPEIPAPLKMDSIQLKLPISFVLK